MKRAVLTISCGMLGIILVAGTAAAEQSLLYSPRPLTAEDNAGSSKDGILVNEITVKRGDTLSKLSKRHNRKGAYYPQILLFNDIPDPDLIYEGSTIRIPVYDRKGAAKAKTSAIREPSPAYRSAEAQTETHAQKTAKETSVEDQAGGERKKSSRKTKRAQLAEKAKQAKAPGGSAAQPGNAIASTRAGSNGPNGGTSEQKQFEKALASYKNNDCQSAVEQFERFLAVHPESVYAADATLFKADCYMKLSQ